MLVVADTTPLLHLARVERLDLLPQLYREILIPQTVWSALVEAWPEAPGVAQLREATWLTVVPDVPPPEHDRDLLATIDAGESAAIALALTRRANLLLIDDAAGRHAAAALGVRLRGTLGVLVSAKAAGLIDVIAPVIEALLAGGFRASPEVVRQALVATGETEAGGLSG